MRKKIKVVIADDHVHYRDGLSATINDDTRMEVVGEAADAYQLIEIVRRCEPDVVITDLIMPGDGIKAIGQLVAKKFQRIIAVSSFDDEGLIVEALEAGAMGYVAKNAERNEITDAVKEVFSFRPHYSKSTSPLLMKEILDSTFNPYIKIKPALFSGPELEVITLLCQGITNDVIAMETFSSLRKVERMRRIIMAKMKVKTKAGLIIYAVKNDLYRGKAY